MTESNSATAQENRSPEAETKIPDYLKNLDVAVREHFAGATDLPTFLAGAGVLTDEERKLIVKQALILIEQNYAHLPLKRAMHSIEPVQRLKLLLQTLEQGGPSEQMSEAEFHREMIEIFTSVRDLHTNYMLPAPFNMMSAFLPFMAEDYFENEKRKYIVSRVIPGFQHPTFVKGVELVYWNGVPIERAVHNNAHRYAGSNREARHARGVQSLTTRALRMDLPPDEEWVIVGYRTDAGTLEEIKLDWIVNPPLPAGVAGGEVEPATAFALGIDIQQDIVQRTRKALFAPHVVEAEQKAVEKTESGAEFGALESTLPAIFEARPVTTPSGTFGYLRIRTFDHRAVGQFVNEFIRLMSALPQNGLIIDVRGNGGGVIMNGELLLQTLTPRQIEPEPVQFINTPLNLEICRRNSTAGGIVDLSQWVDSMKQALKTGAAYSAGFPISDRALCNVIGQRYFGPVVLITDALCYSTTDIFAAGFQDHEIGPILGTDGNTGAGGANVWSHKVLVENIMPGAESVYKPLPRGAGMRVAIRRTLRVGRRAGTPVEDLGVVPDERHFMTKNDLVNNNVDLISKAGSLLAALPVRALKAEVQAASPTELTVLVDAQGITRLDAYLDDRPIDTKDVNGAQTTFTFTKAESAEPNLEIRGFDGTTLVARFRIGV